MVAEENITVLPSLIKLIVGKMRGNECGQISSTLITKYQKIFRHNKSNNSGINVLKRHQITLVKVT